MMSSTEKQSEINKTEKPVDFYEWNKKFIDKRRRKKNRQSKTALVDKYKPKKCSDIIGNKEVVKQVKQFICKWNIKSKKCGILSGPPGIGKTSAVNVIANELAYNIIEFSESQLSGTRSIHEFFDVTNKRRHCAVTDGNVILMDEHDVILFADCCGVDNLLKYISKSKIPIICVCNDQNAKQIRRLTKSEIHFKFCTPTLIQIQNRWKTIVINERCQYNLASMQQFAASTQGDIRQMFHLMQFWVYNNKTDILQFENFRKKLKNSKQVDRIVDVCNVVSTLINAPEINIANCIENCVNRSTNISLIIYENYLNIDKKNNKKCTADELLNFSLAAETFADGDLVDRSIGQSQHNETLQYNIVLSSIKPGFFISRSNYGKLSKKIEHSNWLREYSKKK
eukprot:254158_1